MINYTNINKQLYKQKLTSVTSYPPLVAKSQPQINQIQCNNLLNIMTERSLDQLGLTFRVHVA